MLPKFAEPASDSVSSNYDKRKYLGYGVVWTNGGTDCEGSRWFAPPLER